MEKTIKIGTKEFQMKASAYTQFKYKDITGKSLLKDLTDISKKYESVDGKLIHLDDLDDFLTTALRIAYIMSLEGKSFTGNFDSFLMQIDNYLDDANWISEVVELAISPLSRNLQTIQG